MKVSELKKIFELPFQIKKSFTPITEYIYAKDSIIRATDMEFYIEVKSDTQIPFTGCVLSDKFNKFLNSLSKDEDLTFETNKNVLTAHYGKKNKFLIPMEDVNDFPDSPILKYSEKEPICTLNLTKELLDKLNHASQFTSKTDAQFNGVYIKDNYIYASNREIICKSIIDINIKNIIFIPLNFLKFISKHKIFKTIEIYGCGFKAIGENITLYSSNYTENKYPNFDDVISNYEIFLNTKGEVTEELRNCISRVSLFDEIINIDVKNNSINIYTDNINETVGIPEFAVFNEYKPDDEYVFRFNTNYLNKILECETFALMSKKKSQDEHKISAVWGRHIGETETDIYELICAIIC